MNFQPKQQYKCTKCDKPNFKKGAFTNYMKNAHNISKITTMNEFMDSTNNKSDNIDTNIEIDKLEMEKLFILEHAKEQ